MAPELGELARVLDQDTGNLPWVQRGIRSLKRGFVQLADYNETKLRHFHMLLDKWVEHGETGSDEKG